MRILNHCRSCALGGCVHTQAQDDATCQTGEINMKLITLSLVALALSATTALELYLRGVPCVPLR